ncbi:MAG: zinc metalloprotease HtpX [Tepidisphaeraceae bacterium]|jgi:heat shock protein HtpX
MQKVIMYGQFYNNVKTVLLMGLLTALILMGGDLIGGRQGLVVALVLAGIMNFFGFFFSEQIALASAGAEEVGPDHPLYGIVARLAQRAGLPMPRVYVSPQPAPNAFATGRGPRHAAVCATQGLLDMLDENEISGVLGHELAHVLHRDILIQSVAATIAGAIGYLGYMFMWGGGWGGGRRGRDQGNVLMALLFMLLGPLAAGLIQAALSRSREFNADSGGAQICGNPMWLATALEKIHYANQRIPMDVNPAFNSMYIAEPLNAIGAVGGLFQTHPPLEARLMNLIGRPSTGQFLHAA